MWHIFLWCVLMNKPDAAEHCLTRIRSSISEIASLLSALMCSLISIVFAFSWLCPVVPYKAHISKHLTMELYYINVIYKINAIYMTMK